MIQSAQESKDFYLSMTDDDIAGLLRHKKILEGIDVDRLPRQCRFHLCSRNVSIYIMPDEQSLEIVKRYIEPDWSLVGANSIPSGVIFMEFSSEKYPGCILNIVVDVPSSPEAMKHTIEETSYQVIGWTAESLKPVKGA